MTDPRKNRKAELLAAARERLTSEQEARDAGRPSSNGSAKIRYRGQVMRGGSGGGAPGGGSNSVRYGSRNGAGSDDVRVALEKIKGIAAHY